MKIKLFNDSDKILNKKSKDFNIIKDKKRKCIKQNCNNNKFFWNDRYNFLKCTKCKTIIEIDDDYFKKIEECLEKQKKKARK